MSEVEKRRWIRFNLRTLLILISALALWLGWNVYQIQQRELIWLWDAG
jgi:hypothetical protein